MRDFWDPVQKYGCGWEECPICGPRIAMHKVKAHDDVVKLTWFRTQAALPEDDGKAPKRDYDEVRKEERKAKNAMRIKRVLTDVQRAAAVSLLANWPVRQQYMTDGHISWATDVWLELEHPRAVVAAKEGHLSLFSKIENAVDRVHKRRKREWAEPPMQALLGDETDSDADPFEVLDRGD